MSDKTKRRHLVNGGVTGIDLLAGEIDLKNNRNTPKTQEAQRRRDLARDMRRNVFMPGSVAIIGPEEAIQSEVIASRKWQEVVSTSGVTSFVSRISIPALRGGS